jgi:hypothetical protein
MNDESSASSERCDRCGAASADLQVVLFWGRERRADRYGCEFCTEALFQLFLTGAASGSGDHAKRQRPGA